jgi:hypothetical protein
MAAVAYNALVAPANDAVHSFIADDHRQQRTANPELHGAPLLLFWRVIPKDGKDLEEHSHQGGE